MTRFGARAPSREATRSDKSAPLDQTTSEAPGAHARGFAVPRGSATSARDLEHHATAAHARLELS
jgi:hypothetical protein